MLLHLLTAAFDPGCVKTPKARKPIEWSFSDGSKSDALMNSRDRNRDPTECLFYRSFASPRFYTAKILSGESYLHVNELITDCLRNRLCRRRTIQFLSRCIQVKPHGPLAYT